MTGDCTFFDKNTSFRGRITATDLVVEGSVTGEISASRQVTILNGATVNGPIRTTRILMEEGGRHEGAIRLSRKNNGSADERSAETSETTGGERAGGSTPQPGTESARQETGSETPRPGGNTEERREEKQEERLW